MVVWFLCLWCCCCFFCVAVVWLVLSLSLFWGVDVSYCGCMKHFAMLVLLLLLISLVVLYRCFLDV